MRRCACFFLIVCLSILSLAQSKPAKAAKPAKVKAPSTTLPVTTSSRQAAGFFEKGMVYYETLKLARATEEWRNAVKADPNFALAHAWIAFNSTDPAESSAARKKAKRLAHRVTRGEQLVIKWIVGVQENNFVAGIAAMNDVLAMYPKDKRLFYEASNWLAGRDQNEQSGKMCERALALDKDYPAALNNLAYAYAREGNFPPAFDAMEQYIKVLPNEPNPQDSYAEILRMSGNFPGALEHYRASLKIDPTFYVSQMGLGDTYALMGDEGKARAEYRKAIVANHDPADRLTYAIQSAMTWVRENKLTAANKALTAVAEKAHRQNFGLIEAQAYHLMAMYQPKDSVALHRLGQAEAALEHQRNISQSDREEQRARILRWRAVRASHDGNSQLAEESLKQLETMADGSRSTVIPPSYHAAAGALLVAKQKYAEAIPHLQEDSYDPYSLQNLSRAYTETGDTDDAHAVDTKLRAINLPTMEQALVVIPARTRPPAK